jgi:hypothetical protein
MQYDDPFFLNARYADLMNLGVDVACFLIQTVAATDMRGSATGLSIL